MDPYLFDGGCGRHLQPDALQHAQADAQARHEAREGWRRMTKKG